MKYLSSDRPSVMKGLLKPLCIGVASGVIGCVVLLCLMAGFATALTIPHAYVVPLGTVSLVFGAWLGGWCGVKCIGRNGWLFGLMIAFVLFLLSLLAGIGLLASSDGAFFLIKSILMLASGMLGGMMAVNTHKRTSRRYR